MWTSRDACPTRRKKTRRTGPVPWSAAALLFFLVAVRLLFGVGVPFAAPGGVLVQPVEPGGGRPPVVEVGLGGALGVVPEVPLEELAALAVARLLDVALELPESAFFLVHDAWTPPLEARFIPSSIIGGRPPGGSALFRRVLELALEGVLAAELLARAGVGLDVGLEGVQGVADVGAVLLEEVDGVAQVPGGALHREEDLPRPPVAGALPLQLDEEVGEGVVGQQGAVDEVVDLPVLHERLLG